jgi:hypothetical protein
MIMTEIWWRVFLASIITVVIAKFFGCRWNVFFLFSLSFIGWTIGLILLLAVSGWLSDLSEKRSKKS